MQVFFHVFSYCSYKSLRKSSNNLAISNRVFLSSYFGVIRVLYLF